MSIFFILSSALCFFLSFFLLLYSCLHFFQICFSFLFFKVQYFEEHLVGFCVLGVLANAVSRFQYISFEIYSRLGSISLCMNFHNDIGPYCSKNKANYGTYNCLVNRKQPKKAAVDCNVL